MTVADRIKFKREELDITQDELAKKLGLKGKSSVCKIESSGDNISTKSIRNYANALGVTIAYLMGWESESDPSTAALEHIINVNEENGGNSEMAKMLYRTTVMNSAAFDVTESEIKLIQKFRSATPEVQSAITTLLAFAMDQEKNNNDN
jgi:transcriptional regulator with XRE-family HTH domain